ncbi:MAG: T9SS type A sorting domain-containing protein [Ignavibacteria bacterium]|nr:T9SS type A sorting domain-containing protein [Ignavibacteria bacterium]
MKLINQKTMETFNSILKRFIKFALITLLGLNFAYAQSRGVSVCKVQNIGDGTNVSFTSPYPPFGNMNVFAGVFNSTIDNNSAKMYCIDIKNNLVFNEVYNDSGFTPSKITYILNNYYPYKTYPYAGSLNTVGKEAAAVQISVWHFSDGVDANTVTNSEIKNRALQIIADADANAGSVLPVKTLQIVPVSMLHNPSVKDTIQIKALNELGAGVSGINVTLTINSGTLSTLNTTTGAGGLSPKITVTKGASYTATIKASASVIIPQGTRYVHLGSPTTKQKLVIATPTYGTKEDFFECTWDSTSSGNNGGVESSYDLAEALFVRHNKIANGETTPLLSNNVDVFPLTYTLEQIIPMAGPYSTGRYETTPFDILGISNATSAYAADYKINSSSARIGAIFATTTNAPNIYSHTKSVCDRLANCNLEDLQRTLIDGHEFYAAKIVNPAKHYVDYSVVFSVYETANGFIVDNKWTIPEYVVPAGTTNVYNFQVWGADFGATSILVKSILAKLASFTTVKYQAAELKYPDVYMKSAKYTNDGKIKIKFINTTGVSQTIPVTYTYTPQTGMSSQTLTQNVNLPHGESEYNTTIGIMSGASVNLTCANGFKDAAFIGGGVYGSYAGASSTIQQFSNVVTSGNQNLPQNSLIFPGGARMKGTLGDKVYIGRSLDGSYEGINLSNFLKLRFECAGSGTLSVYLEVKSGNNTYYPYVNVPLTSSVTTREIALNTFLINGQPADLSSVSMVTFQLSKSLNPSVSSYDYTIQNAAIIANSVGIGSNTSEAKEYSLSQNYPNPFNPVTKIAFSLPKQGNVTLKVYNMLGKEVTELVNGFRNSGSYEVNFDGASLSSGVYFYKLEAEGFSEVKRMMLIK